MEENHNTNNGMLPQIRPTGSFLAFWSVLLGGFGLASDCFPCSASGVCLPACFSA
uniref:hypothetical protein n=1 Tax=Clostridium sp. NkU-1 TaxID=1095009 RepID=UPI000AA46345